jgi:hypothetical protein
LAPFTSRWEDAATAEYLPLITRRVTTSMAKVLRMLAVPSLQGSIGVRAAFALPQLMLASQHHDNIETFSSYF